MMELQSIPNDSAPATQDMSSSNLRDSAGPVAPDNPSTTVLPESKNIDLGVLLSRELFWRDHQPWLEEKGYMLRPRYKPDWVAS